MERLLKPGNTIKSLDGTEYTISSVKGSGANCIVYNAVARDKALDIPKTCLLKEYNPLWAGLSRNADGELIPSEKDRARFEESLEKFKETCKKQIKIRESFPELCNCTTIIQHTFEANGTFYVNMPVFCGETFDNAKEDSLFGLVKKIISITEVISKYHDEGLLHLDLKPANFLVTPENMIMLFDFDSVAEIESLKSQNSAVSLSYSQDWAAPELICAKRELICPATDIFSIGEIFFSKLYGRHSKISEKRSFSKYPAQTQFGEVNEDVLKALTIILRHTICSGVTSRYQSAEELIEALKRLQFLADPKSQYIISSSVKPSEPFIGRDNELEQIHEYMQKSHCVMLLGEEGIGKSEIAKEYIRKYSNEYGNIIYISTNSFPVKKSGYTTIPSSFFQFRKAIADYFTANIAHIPQRKEEPLHEYFSTILDILRICCKAKKTLFVINSNRIYEEEQEAYNSILKLPCDFLIIPRLFEWPVGPGTFHTKRNDNKSITVEKLKDEDLTELFCDWRKETLQDEDSQAIQAIIEWCHGNTMILQLAAKLSAEMRLTPSKMIEMLYEPVESIERMVGDIAKTKELPGEYSCHACSDSIFLVLSALLKISQLSAEQAAVLLLLSILPTEGIPEKDLMEIFGLTANDMENIKRLAALGWVIYDNKQGIVKVNSLIADFIRIYYADPRAWPVFFGVFLARSNNTNASEKTHLPAESAPMEMKLANIDDSVKAVIRNKIQSFCERMKNCQDNQDLIARVFKYAHHLHKYRDSIETQWILESAVPYIQQMFIDWLNSNSYKIDNQIAYFIAKDYQDEMQYENMIENYIRSGQYGKKLQEDPGFGYNEITNSRNGRQGRIPSLEALRNISPSEFS